MLIQCSGCDAKISVPPSAVGKRVQCPGCQRVIRVPAPEGAETKPPASDKIKPPAASPPPPIPIEPVDPEGISASPPPATKSKAAWDDDEAKDEEDEPRRPKKRRRDTDYDDRDDDHDDGDDDDDLDVRKRRRSGVRRQPVNGMAMTSMILGVVSAAFGVPGCLGCCCHADTAIAFICGLIAVILGHMNKSASGNETYTLTGIICGYVGIGLSVLGIVLLILRVTLHIGLMN